MPFKVILVDDEQMVLNSLMLSIDWEAAGFQILEACTNSLEAYDKICLLKPDVVFVDIKMPQLNGLELMKKVKEVIPKVQFVVISGHAEFAYVQKALSYGASAYCLKPFEDDELNEILNALREKLEKKRAMLHSAFWYMMEVQNNSSVIQFNKLLCEEGISLENATMGIGSGSISSLIDSDVHFLEIKNANNEYFYFFENPNKLRSLSFQHKLMDAIKNDVNKGFSFCLLKNFNNDLIVASDTLKNFVYSYFFETTNSEFEVYHSICENDSQYIKEIEIYACKNNIVCILELLSSYRTLLQPKDYTIKNALKIYNVCMALLYRVDDNYFDAIIVHEVFLIEDFQTFDNMVTYLVKMLGGHTSNKINMDLIKNDTFKQILEYINTNFTYPISFHQICYTYSINPSYLSQVFKKEIGITFTNYITQLRMNYAKDLLCNTNIMVSEVSEKVGYEQYFYFSKLFKKLYGISPKQFRDENQYKH